MKKTIYILAAALLALMACNKEVAPVNGPSEESAVAAEGQMVTLNFTATFPDTQIPTKGAMGDTPVIDNLYVAIFGQSSNANGGNLQHWAPATLSNVSSDATHTYTADYEVTLPLSNEGREVVFIANYPGSEPPTFDREKVIMRNLYTEGNNGAYWQRVSLSNGIRGKEVDGKLVLDDATAAALKDVHLVRNYAKITVSEALPTAEFTIHSYTLINVPTRGSIAPMNNDSFETPYTQIKNWCDGDSTDFVGKLDQFHYLGYMPENTGINQSDPGEGSMVAPGSEPNGGFYMFERPVPTQSNTQTAVIVKLTWKDEDWFAKNAPNSENKILANKTYWYKIEVIGANGENIPIRRNIWYKINLLGLTGDGEQSYASAFSGQFFGNVSASIETATLNEITDNTSTIRVSRMDYTTVEDGDQVDIYFQYQPEKNGNIVTTEGNDVTVSIRTIDGYSQSIDSKTTAETATYLGANWGKITVTLKDQPGSGMLRGALRIQGNKAGKRVLYRDVIFTVMADADFASTNSDLSVSGNNVTLNIKLPEKLSFSVFPIQVMIEAQNNNLTTNDPLLPVGFGPSAFSTTNPKKNSFYFIRTINYSDYYKKNATTGNWEYTTSFPCTLKKTDNQALVIRMNAKYFNQKQLPAQ